MNKSKTAWTAGSLLVLTAPAVAAANEEQRIERLENKVEALTEAIERGTGGGRGGLGDTTLGGYGEIHYNNFEPDDGSADTEQVDFHRFIIEIGHQFNDDVRFFSELEFEHAVLEPELETEPGTAAGQNVVTSAELENEGELKLEQGYIEVDLNDRQRVQAGLFLMPVGILNESHEPPRFYGVERNQVEDAVIPTTWAQTGALLKGNLGESGLSYDIGLHTGLDDDNGVIEDGVQLAAKAEARDLAGTGRLKYTGISGLELAASVNHNTDISQDSAGADEATLVSGHAIYNIGRFELTGLFAQWSVDGDVTDAAEDQGGGYLQAAYKPIESVGVFVRASNIDIAINGGQTDLDRDQTIVGVNYWLTPDVVFKADAFAQSARDSANDGLAGDGFNLGIGYQF